MTARAPNRRVILFATAAAMSWTTSAIPQETPAAPEPLYRQYAAGLLTRSVYSTRDHVIVELWDLMVGPGKSSDPATLPGSAILEVRTGAGTLEHSGQRNKLQLGATATIPAETKFRLMNASRTEPLVLRAIIIKPLTP